MKCKKSKKNCVAGDKPAVVKTHLRNCIIMPEMVGNFVGVYSGKTFNPV
jgi:small subunit ribosomal protein S15e